ncbi:hypothetical protein [Proteiniphilum saccharofermentans]|uniref:hypothetical protein n=1 Tax=Proteiniphilum saccharofermentans TaxID=1642647 RepID=UPI0028A5F835|nr:hypothetical protein [Proteiniphilum saccharofermentans]
MKQYSLPVIIKDGEAFSSEKISLNTNFYTENWIQEICFKNPELLPIEEIEPTFGGMIPICRELQTNSGYIDLIYINKFGFITIGECKLWRNPEARRKAVGQILDYAKDLSKWNYSKLEKECKKAGKYNKSLFSIIHEYYLDIEESDFIDNVQKNLHKGRFLLAIIGDGIRENMEELAEYIQRNGNLNFTLGLIELPIFKNPTDGTLIITPRILAKTKEIERVIFRVSNNQFEESTYHKTEEVKSQTISEKVFYERLLQAIGEQKTNEFQMFVENLSDQLNINPKLGRGQRLSLNLKSADDSLNFASLQENGEVWFYGIVNKTEEIGSKQIGIDYLNNLANLVTGNLDTSTKEWN